MAPCAGIPSNIAEIAGPLLIACVLNWTLFGVLCLQVYLYFEGYPHDSIYIKIMVYFVFALEIVQSVLFLDSVFYSLARGFGDMAALDRIGTIWLSVPFIDGLVAWIVQTFYGYRVYVLSRSKILTVIICFLALVQFVASVVTAAAGSRAGTFTNLLKENVLISNSIWEGGSALCDIVIAVTMTYVLKKRDSGAIQSTHDFITRIIRLTVETGALTAVVAIIALILTFVPPGKTYYQVGVVVLGKLYSTTLLVLLNIRPRRQPGGTICCCGNMVGEDRGTTARGTRARATGGGALRSVNLSVSGGVGVSIETETQKDDIDEEHGSGEKFGVDREAGGVGDGTGRGTVMGSRRKRGTMDAEAAMAARRQALYVPATGSDTGISGSSTDQSAGSLVLEKVYSEDLKQASEEAIEVSEDHQLPTSEARPASRNGSLTRTSFNEPSPV